MAENHQWTPVLCVWQLIFTAQLSVEGNKNQLTPKNNIDINTNSLDLEEISPTKKKTNILPSSGPNQGSILDVHLDLESV